MKEGNGFNTFCIDLSWGINTRVQALLSLDRVQATSYRGDRGQNVRCACLLTEYTNAHLTRILNTYQLRFARFLLG